MTQPETDRPPVAAAAAPAPRPRLTLAIPLLSSAELIIAGVVLALIVAGAGALYAKGHADGYAGGYATARAQDQAAADAQAAAIEKIKADTEQQLADAAAMFRKQHEADQNEIAKLDAETNAAPGAGDVVWHAGVMRHLRNIWAGQH